MYVDSALPFGLHSSPITFSAIADALEFMIRKKGDCEVGHYLDDIVMLGSPNSPVSV